MVSSRIRYLNYTCIMLFSFFYAVHCKSFVMKIAGTKSIAERIAAREGLVVQHEIKRNLGVYLLHLSKMMEEENPSDTEVIWKLMRHNAVKWAKPRESLHSNTVAKPLVEQNRQTIVQPPNATNANLVPKPLQNQKQLPVFEQQDTQQDLKFHVKPPKPEAELREPLNVKMFSMPSSKPLVKLDPEAVSCFRSSKDRSAMYYCRPLVNDPTYFKQWFMLPWPSAQGQSAPYDLNIIPVWIKYNNFGQGVKVIVVDRGIETTHKDLANNYDPQYGYDAVDNDDDPNPKSPEYNHGTKCAGLIAMVANNRICGVGIAPLVTLGAIRALDTESYDTWTPFTRAVLFKHKEVDITSNSYSIDGLFVPLQYNYISALKTSVAHGRRGKGVIHVFAGSNDKDEGHMCGSNAFINSMHTIAVATCDVSGQVTAYSERCPAIMVTVFASHWGINAVFNLPTTTSDDQCAADFGYTSSGTARASGILALALSANPELTLRDVQHLLAWTCRFLHVDDRGVWQKNKAGFYVSEDFGFGLMDAYNLVTMALTFKHVPPMSTCAIDIVGGKSKLGRKGIRFGYNLPVKKKVHINACLGIPEEVKYAEHVQLLVSLTHVHRGDVQIKITSPGGTQAKVLDKQTDPDETDIDNWIFDSVMTWGESPIGKWIIEVYAETGLQNNEGKITRLSLIIHGTNEKPQHYGPKGSFRTEESYRLETYQEMLNH